MSQDQKKQKRICVVGSANVDLTFRTSRLPVPGETLAGQSLHRRMEWLWCKWLVVGAAGRVGSPLRI